MPQYGRLLSISSKTELVPQPRDPGPPAGKCHVLHYLGIFLSLGMEANLVSFFIVQVLEALGCRLAEQTEVLKMNGVG